MGWAGVVTCLELFVDLLNFPIPCNVNSISLSLSLSHRYREPISLALHEVMLKITICMKELWLVVSMESSGDFLPATR